MRHITVTIILILTLKVSAQQTPMRDLNELINKHDSGWIMVKDWISQATNIVEILPKDSLRADSGLVQAQVTTRSPMGAVIYESGGILIDSGWIRILGSGSKRLDRSLMDWNRGKSFKNIGDPISFLLIADDVLGGFFAINAGGIDSNNIGKVYYFAPDNMTWQNTNLGYSDFLLFCFQGNLNEFYKGLRWNNWMHETSGLNGNQGIYCFPFLWTKQGMDINTVNRTPVPIQELWDLFFTKKDK